MPVQEVSVMSAGDWITLLSTALAAASFVWGVISWRASYLGQKRIELAEQVYELTLNCLDHVRYIRNPGGYEGEGSTRLRNDNERPEETQIYDRAYVAIERMERKKDDFNKLFSLMPRFGFYFGAAAAKPIEEIDSVLGDIRSASSKLRRYWLRQDRHFRNDEEFQRHLAGMEQSEAVFWNSGGQDDPINPKLASIALRVASTCDSAIDPKPNIWRILSRTRNRMHQFIRIPKDDHT